MEHKNLTNKKTYQLGIDDVIGISWDYRCGFSSKNNFERIYKAEVNGVTVWKNAQRHKVSYTIGENKLRYNSENELLRAIEDGKK